MERLSDDVTHAKLLDLDQGEVELGELWKSQPVVLAFVRHFG